MYKVYCATYTHTLTSKVVVLRVALGCFGNPYFGPLHLCVCHIKDQHCSSSMPRWLPLAKTGNLSLRHAYSRQRCKNIEHVGKIAPVNKNGLLHWM